MSVWLQFNELVVRCEGGNPSEKSNGTLPASLKGDVISSSFQQWSKLKITNFQPPPTMCLTVFLMFYIYINIYINKKSARTLKASWQNLF